MRMEIADAGVTALPRRVEPEWLDVLPASDPRAMRSRRDLARVNVVMRQAPIMARALLRNAAAPPRRILDLGAGDGAFMLSVARRLSARWPNVTVALLDQQSIVSAATLRAFEALGWRALPVAADALTYLQEPADDAPDIITANLFLHHFRQDDLAAIIERAAERAPLFVACEPERRSYALAASKLLFALGCNDVSRHDATASVRAGFRGRELSALWPGAKSWILREELRLPFTHLFVAQRAGRDAS
jgi:hypothetical protein